VPLTLPDAPASAGVGLEGLAVATSARHQVDPGVRAWVSSAPRPWAVTAEAGFSWRTDARAALYTSRTFTTTVAGLAEVAAGPHAVVARLGVGPALVVQRATVAGGTVEAAGWTLAPGARARLAFDGPVPWLDPAGWQVRVGATPRVGGTDWDVGAGVGVRW
jgi:hypothetical protein